MQDETRDKDQAKEKTRHGKNKDATKTRAGTRHSGERPSIGGDDMLAIQKILQHQGAGERKNSGITGLPCF